jgi:hypothetical protein
VREAIQKLGWLKLGVVPSTTVNTLLRTKQLFLAVWMGILAAFTTQSRCGTFGLNFLGLSKSL